MLISTLSTVIIARNKLDILNKYKVSREKVEKKAKYLNYRYIEVIAKSIVKDIFFSIIKYSRLSLFYNSINRASEDKN